MKGTLNLIRPFGKRSRGVRSPMERRQELHHGRLPSIKANLIPRYMFRLRPIPRINSHTRKSEQTRDNRMIRKPIMPNSGTTPKPKKFRGTPYKVTDGRSFVSGVTWLAMMHKVA